MLMLLLLLMKLLLMLLLVMMMLLKLCDEMEAGENGDAGSDEIDSVGGSDFDRGRGEDSTSEGRNHLDL